MAGDLGSRSFHVRPFRPGDEQGVLATLQAAFGHWPGDAEVEDPLAHFRWKHFEGPWGPSLLFVAEAGTEIVGFEGWLRARLTVGARTLEVLRAVDLGVRPDHRGRGVGAALSPQGAANAPPGTALSMGNPNPLSRSGALRLGRHNVGRFPVYVRLRRPVRTLLRRPSTAARAPAVDAPTAAEALADRTRVPALLAAVAPHRSRLAPAKDLAYLSWRYAAPGLYHAVPLEEGGRLAGLGIFRIVGGDARPRMRICELLVADDDRPRARRLLGLVLAAADVDYATCHFSSDTVQRSAARRKGFLRLWSWETLLVYPLERVQPDPLLHRSWSLTLGDFDLV
jgi:GNAT superfamily N-acetyltransferase